jgi:hypothetical protein
MRVTPRVSQRFSGCRARVTRGDDERPQLGDIRPAGKQRRAESMLRAGFTEVLAIGIVIR